jgi:hypothetical protein
MGVEASPQRIFAGTDPGDAFGQSVSSAGDVNTDGFADVIVGARDADPGGRSNAGTASVFFGSASGVMGVSHRVFEGVASGDAFGVSVACAGDTNGDGFMDVIIGARDVDFGVRSNVGAASVFNGSPSGLAALPQIVLQGAMNNDAFGAWVASATAASRRRARAVTLLLAHSWPHDRDGSHATGVRLRHAPCER